MSVLLKLSQFSPRALVHSATPFPKSKLVKLLGTRVVLESALKHVKFYLKVIMVLFRYIWPVNFI